MIRHSAGLTRFARVSARPAPRPRRLRRREGPGEILTAHAHERERKGASPERVRLQRVGAGAAAGGPEHARGDRARLRDRSGPGQESLQPGIRGARGFRPRERKAALGDGRSLVVPGPQRFPGATGGAPPRSPVGPLRSGARSLRRAARLRHSDPGGDAPPRVPHRAGEGCGRGPRAAGPAWSRGRRGDRPGGRAPELGRHPRHGPGPYAGRLLRPDDEPLAALSGRELPAVGPIRLLPAGRRLRVPRPASGRHGLDAGPAGSLQRTPVASRRPAIPRRRRPALVARAERPGHPDALFRRPVMASLRGGALRPDDGRRGRTR